LIELVSASYVSNSFLYIYSKIAHCERGLDKNLKKSIYTKQNIKIKQNEMYKRISKKKKITKHEALQ